MKYKHLFFDLDRTLWDFDANSHEALQELFESFELVKRGLPSFEVFYENYKHINLDLWEKYRNGTVDRPFLSLHRFLNTLRLFQVDDRELALKMSEEYVRLVSVKTKLFPDAREVLAYLAPKYHLHVITNGFADVQYRKLENGGLRAYFDKVITSEEAGVHKPAPGIFTYAFRQAGACADESLMIGDDPEVDLKPATVLGMDQMYVNHEGLLTDEKFTYEVRSLREIMDVL